MDIISISLVLLLAVVVSEFITRLIPVKIAAPLLQIAVGVVLSAGFGVDVQFDPHVFLLLFIPPLLFLDGWRIPQFALAMAWHPRNHAEPGLEWLRELTAGAAGIPSLGEALRTGAGYKGGG